MNAEQEKKTNHLVVRLCIRVIIISEFYTQWWFQTAEEKVVKRNREVGNKELD